MSSSSPNAKFQVEAVAAVNENTVVVVHSVGPVYMPWSAHPNITAIIYAGAPGEQTGPSVVDVLYGKYNPSGRLPFSIADVWSDFIRICVSNANRPFCSQKTTMVPRSFITASDFQMYVVELAGFDLIDNLLRTCRSITQRNSCLTIVTWNLEALHHDLSLALVYHTPHSPILIYRSRRLEHRESSSSGWRT